ncbi:MAG: hypothetical protein ABJG47_01450 [Ekhidna sp.]
MKTPPKNYVSGDLESITFVIKVGFLLLPALLSFMFVLFLFQGEYTMALVLAIGLLFTFYARKRLLGGNLHKAVILTVVFFNVLLTLICTLGNGINDIAIVGYPIIIGFSGIILDQKKLALATSLSLIGVTWLVVSEHFQIHNITYVYETNSSDFFIISFMIVIGGFVAFSLMNIMKNALANAQSEISISKNEADNLAEQVGEKLEIIEEIHRTAINSLTHIQQLISYQRKSSHHLAATYSSLTRKVLVIETAHQILLSTQTPMMLEIQAFTIELVKKYERKKETQAIQINTDQVPLMIRSDIAINYGICILELIHEADGNANGELCIDLMTESAVLFKLSGFVSTKTIEQGIVMDLLTKQLKGVLTKSTQEFTFTFTPEAG